MEQWTMNNGTMNNGIMNNVDNYEDGPSDGPKAQKFLMV